MPRHWESIKVQPARVAEIITAWTGIVLKCLMLKIMENFSTNLGDWFEAVGIAIT